MVSDIPRAWGTRGVVVSTLASGPGSIPVADGQKERLIFSAPQH